MAAEATARATARSAAGSVTRIPPATEANTSTAMHRQVGVTGQHGQGHDQAAAVQADHRALGLGLAHGGHQGLELDHQGAAALHGREHHAAGHPDQPVPEQEPAGVVDPVEALVAHLEQPELAGGPEPVLDGQEEPEGMVPVPLEAEHGVHHVLEGPGTGQRAVLGHVTDQHRGHLAGTWPGRPAGRRTRGPG